MFGEVGLVTRLVRKLQIMSVRVWRFRFNVGTSSKSLDKCRYAFSEVGLVSGLDRRSRFFVASCPARSVEGRDINGDIGFVSGLVRRSRVIVGTFTARLS